MFYWAMLFVGDNSEQGVGKLLQSTMGKDLSEKTMLLVITVLSSVYFSTFYL